MSKNEIAQDWEARIKLGLEYRKKVSSEANWPVFRQQYRGYWDAGLLPLNRVHSMGKSLIPRIYFKTPSVMITPLRPEFEASAMIVEAIDNMLIRELNLKKTMKRAIQQCYLSGYAPIKLGYDSEFGYVPSLAVDTDSGTATQYSEKSGEDIEFRTYVKPGMPWAMCARPDDVVLPWGYEDTETAPWIAHCIFREVKDVKEDSKYTNTKELKGGYTQANNQIKNPFTKENSAEEYCLLWEVRDKRTRKVYVISEGLVLLEEEDTLMIEGFNYEFLVMNEDLESPYGISDVHLMQPQQQELNEIRTQASKLRKLSVIKWLYQKGLIKPEDMDKVLSTDLKDIGAGIEVAADSISSAIHELQPHNTVDDTIKAGQETESDMRETFGYGRNQMGEMSPFHGKTATEAQIVQSASEIRTDERKDIAADCMTNIIRKWNQYIFKFWTGQKVIQVVGPSGAARWIKFTGEEIIGEYAYKVDPDPGLPVTRGMRYQMNKELLEMFKDDPFIDQLKLRKKLLAQFDWLDPTSELLLQDPKQQLASGDGSSPNQPMPYEQLADQIQQGRGGGR